MRSYQVVAIPAGSSAGGFTSDPIPCDQCTRMSAQAVLAGGNNVTGVLCVQVSNDKPPPGTTLSTFRPTNWSTLTTVTVSGVGTAANGANGMVFSNELCAEFLRLHWKLTSAAVVGTVKATAVLMGAGGQ